MKLQKQIRQKRHASSEQHLKRRWSSLPVYETEFGQMYCGAAETVLKSKALAMNQKKVQLVFSSPPYPLARKKEYGNKQGLRYAQWLEKYAPILCDYLTDNGSIVLEVGNAWVPGKPIMSTVVIEALLRFLKRGRLHLCQEFIWYNPARLPSPAQWVNVERIRVKDSFTRIWWMSRTPKPKANNRNILRSYSKSMEDLLERQSYNAGRRPSEHLIGERSFLKNNGGAIPSNVLESHEMTNLLKAANTRPDKKYQQYCEAEGLRVHPARMLPEIAEFFVKFLTDEGDVVMDPFAGSNTTGAVAESLKRRWISIDQQMDYVVGSQARFERFTKSSSSCPIVHRLAV